MAATWAYLDFVPLATCSAAWLLVQKKGALPNYGNPRCVKVSLQSVFIATVPTSLPFRPIHRHVNLGRCGDRLHYISCHIVSLPTALDTPSTNQHVSTVFCMVLASDPTNTVTIPVQTPNHARHNHRGRMCTTSSSTATSLPGLRSDHTLAALVPTGD